MKMSGWVGFGVGFAMTAAGLAQGVVANPAVTPTKMQRVATVDERYQSFNVEMVEVTGGRFWAPYGAKAAGATKPVAGTPVGLDPSLYQYRGPIDLGNARLRMLAAALGPSYMRVSGTWANSTYFQDSDGPALKSPPAGFGTVLTRAEWKGVIDFAKAVDAELVTSFAISPGVRDADGVWTPVEAKKLLAFTKSAGGSIAAAEMFNEPTFAGMGGAPKGYGATTYGQDFKAFRAYVKEAAPEMKILGPGAVGEGTTLAGTAGMGMLKSDDLLRESGPGLDAFSYHFYGGVSQRCSAAGLASGTTVDAALSADWLGRSEKNEAYYAKVRDKWLPGGPMWLTETGETACGGDPWASTFVDSFRYLNQLGSLAKRGVQVVMHNTLAASEYALIDGRTLEPRPNYWAAVLWRRLMGRGVLDAGISGDANLYVYAQCMRGTPGGVTMLVINADKVAARTLGVPVKGERYTLAATELLGQSVTLNGRELEVGADNVLPKLDGMAVNSGALRFAPETITFLTMSGAGNEACR
jgi:heparanase 1